MLLDVVGRIHVLYTGIVLSSSHWCRVWCYRGCTVAGAIRDMLNTSGMRASAGEIHGAFAGSFEFDWPQSELSVKYMQSLRVDLYHFAAVGYYFTWFCLFLQPL